MVHGHGRTRPDAGSVRPLSVRPIACNKRAGKREPYSTVVTAASHRAAGSAATTGWSDIGRVPANRVEAGWPARQTEGPASASQSARQSCKRMTERLHSKQGRIPELFVNRLHL